MKNEYRSITFQNFVNKKINKNYVNYIYIYICTCCEFNFDITPILKYFILSLHHTLKYC